jgi:putative addiction module CopG family antidote
MQIDLPAEQQTFIENLVASGQFSSENHAMSEAVRLLISREQLKQAVQLGIEQADRGMLLDHDTVFGQLRMMATAQPPETGQ